MFTTNYLYIYICICIYIFPPGLGFIYYYIVLISLVDLCTLNKLVTIDDTPLITFCSDRGGTKILRNIGSKNFELKKHV